MTNNELRALVVELENAGDAYDDLHKKRSSQQGTDSYVTPVVVTSLNDEIVLAKDRVDTAQAALTAYYSANPESSDGKAS